MKQSKSDFINSAIYRDAINGSLAQSVMLISADKYALSTFAEYLVSTLMCEGSTPPCGECGECQKIKHKNHVDVQVYPKSNKTINSSEIAEILEQCYQAPYASDKKIFVLNDANSIEVNMQNKLLKTLEEPPKDTYFLLLVTEDNNILPTIKSRCRKWHLPVIGSAEILGELDTLSIDDTKKYQVLNYCGGNCSLAREYAGSSEFIQIVQFTQDLFKNFRKSSQMINYATKAYGFADNFEDFITIFLKNCSDAVRVWCGETVDNPLAPLIAKEFSVNCLVAMVKNCGAFVEKRNRNCNFNGLIDSFLFMILEERHKWPV